MLMKIKKNLQGMNSRMDEAKNQINDLELKQAKTTDKNNKKKKIIQKNEDSVSSLWDNFKYTNICIMGVPEGEERDQEIGNLLEKMTEIFPNLVKDIDIQVLEAQRVSNKMIPKRPIPRHIIIKMPKVKDEERILKAAREKQIVTSKGAPIRLSADFSTETLQTRGIGKKYSK